MKPRKPINPFYILLLLSGVAFAITACAFGVMTVRELRSSRIAGYRIANETRDELGPPNFNTLVDQHGPKAMVIEIVLLAIGTMGAIAYDQHIDKQSNNPASEGESE